MAQHKASVGGGVSKMTWRGTIALVATTQLLAEAHGSRLYTMISIPSYATSIVTPYLRARF